MGFDDRKITTEFDSRNRNIGKKKGKKRLMPVPYLIVIDVVLIGVSLVVFSLFHHVIPSFGSVDLSLQNGGKTTPPKSVATPPKQDPLITQDPSITRDPSSTDPVSTYDPVQAAAIGWGTKFPGKFTDGEIIKTENSYKSKDINITITKVAENGITYYIQDIYIRKIENLRTGFAKGQYGKGYRESVLDMSERYNAVCAINGDYYGTGNASRVVLRNGYNYGANTSSEDVCIIYYNGTMETYSRNNFYMDQLMENDPYQVWEFGPSLLTSDGKAISQFTSTVRNKNPRTAIGYYEPGHYCFVTVDGRQDHSNGMTLAELSKLFESLGCKAAYNLDGGQTSEMVFLGKTISMPYNGGRRSSDIVLVCEWEEE